MDRATLAFAIAGLVSMALGGFARAATCPPDDLIAYTDVMAYSDDEPPVATGAFRVNASYANNTNGTQTWCYTVTMIPPKLNALSHWVLALCTSATSVIVPGSITGTAGQPGVVTTDGSTGYYGIKWDETSKPTDFVSGTFCFTLSEQRCPVNVPFAVVKAGKGVGAAHIMGPSCDVNAVQPVPLPPAVLMGGLVIGGMIGRRVLRRRAA